MTKNPVVFFDLSIGDRDIGRLEMELYTNVVPRTAENFRALCTGERGVSSLTKKPLYFKGSRFHRIIKGFMAQGGDFTRGDGRGGEAIYGSKFRDENFILKHDSPHLLSMANSGPHTNGSQFFITEAPAFYLDRVHSVFGLVIEGMDVVREIAKVPCDHDEKPLRDVVLHDVQIFRR